ncbi:MAG: ABC transporter permease [Anaerolineae bacterium]|nr:MAG: ABC transporter permease [Anaerolineae bacterium]
MIWKNLVQRKGRTLLTVLGIGVGVMAIVILGSLAEGITSGYDSIVTGGNADLVLTQPDVLDVSLSGIDQDLEIQLLDMAEIAKVSGMVQGIVTAGDAPYFFIFGYSTDSFMLDRFTIQEGVGLDSPEAHTGRGTPIIIGRAIAEALNKGVGDTLRLTSTTYRIVGIYETGSAFEDGGGVLALEDAQILLGRQRQVGAFYILLKDPELRERVIERANRIWPDLSITTATDFADQQIVGESMDVMVAVIGGMAIVIGGVGMANAQLMAVFERTREIGVLRAVGWSSRRVLVMIFQESMLLSFVGGVFGLALGMLTLRALRIYLVVYGASPQPTPKSLLTTGIVVAILGIVGGIYPAWRASLLQPVEALRYEGGGSGGTQRRFPFGGMAMQSLWQRRIRTLLTLAAIGLTIGSVAGMQASVSSLVDSIGKLATGTGGEIFLRQANVADTSQSVIDERITDQIAALSEVHSAAGVIFTAIAMPDNFFFIIQGMAPNEFAISRFTIIEGEPLRTNHQIIIGANAALALNKDIGDTLELGGSRFKVVGIYETGIGWMDIGGVLTLHDAQIFTGKPRKVTMTSVKLVNPADAEAVVERLNQQFPDIHASLSGEFAEQMPDIQATNAMLGSVSFMAVLIGGIGVANTMLMAVMERTREIGTLRALGWRRRAVLGMILKESLLLGFLGGILGLIIAQAMIASVSLAESTAGLLPPLIPLGTAIQALLLSIALGAFGGIYPAIRATRMRPVEALRYE